MRWTSKKFKPTSKPKEGDIRIKSYFAVFPIKISSQSRWLEKVTIKQKFTRTFFLNYYEERSYYDSWKDLEFVD